MKNLSMKFIALALAVPIFTTSAMAGDASTADQRWCRNLGSPLTPINAIQPASHPRSAAS